MMELQNYYLQTQKTVSSALFQCHGQHQAGTLEKPRVPMSLLAAGSDPIKPCGELGIPRRTEMGSAYSFSLQFCSVGDHWHHFIFPVVVQDVP